MTKKADPIQEVIAFGQIEHFTVQSVSQVSALDAAARLFSRDSTLVSQLNIITCGGSFNRGTGTYSDRIIVTAALTQ